MIPRKHPSLLQTEGSSSMDPASRILPPKGLSRSSHYHCALKEHRSSKEIKPRPFQGEEDQGLSVSRNTRLRDKRSKVQGKKCTSDHLGHNCSGLRKGHRSDQQMQRLSPKPCKLWVSSWSSQGETGEELGASRFSTLLTRQVLSGRLGDASQNHLLSPVFIFSRAAITRYHRLGCLDNRILLSRGN